MNIVDRPPTKESGLYKAPSHKDGGVRVIVDDSKVFEVEGQEYHICRAAMENSEILEFKNQTNKQILNAIFKRSQCVFEQGKGSGKDFIVCKLVVLDPAKRSISGTAKEIINILQSEKSCKVSSDASGILKQDGGTLTNEGPQSEDLPVSCGLAVIMDGKILLGHRTGSNPEKHFGIPKGHHEHSEDYLMTALREAQEEIGLTLRPHIIDRLKGIEPNVIHCRRQGQNHAYKLVYYYIVPIENLFVDTNLPGEIVPEEWLQKEEMDWAGFVPIDKARQCIMATQAEILDKAFSENTMELGGSLIRFRPYDTFYFEPPIKGLNGSELLSYKWEYEWTEEFKPTIDEVVAKRISDWSQAEASADTGRNIVHKYTVRLADGSTQTVSSESVPALMGYADKKAMKSFPSLVNGLKTLAQQKMKLGIMEARQIEYDQMLERLIHAEKPAVEKGGRLSDDSKFGGATIFRMGSAWTLQEDIRQVSPGGEVVYIKPDQISEERLMNLTRSWVDDELRDAGLSDQRSGIWDMKRRIEKQEKKIKTLTANTDSIGEKMEDGGDLKSEEPMSEPAYLMTLSEYQQKVSPILIDYFKFIRKNEDYLKKSDYYGLYYYTFPEVDSRFRNNTLYGRQSIYLDRNSEYNQGSSDDQIIENYWDPGDDIKNLPYGIQETKDEFIKKISRFFALEIIYSKFEDDEKKSNKRSVKRAIEDDTYKKLLEDNKIEFSRLKEIADSVGVKIPKKVIDARTDSGLTQEKYDELYKNIPKVNYSKLKQIQSDIDESFKDFAELIFVKMKNQYTKNIEDIKAMSEITKDQIGALMPYAGIFVSIRKDNLIRVQNDSWIDSKGVLINKLITEFYSIPELTPDYVSRLDRAIRMDIESMKFPLMASILENFSRITKPISTVEKLYVNLTPRSRGHVFEGAFRFDFENGSAFTFVTEAITAGGWNIQRLHLRYLTHFRNVVLADGTIITVDSLYDILNHFADKNKNPHAVMIDRINDSESTQQVIDAVYFILKTIHGKGITGVRKSPTSISFNIDRRYINRTKRLPTYIGFEKPSERKQLLDLSDAKKQAIYFLTNYIPESDQNRPS